MESLSEKQHNLKKKVDELVMVKTELERQRRQRIEHETGAKEKNINKELVYYRKRLHMVELAMKQERINNLVVMH